MNRHETATVHVMLRGIAADPGVAGLSVASRDKLAAALRYTRPIGQRDPEWWDTRDGGSGIPPVHGAQWAAERPVPPPTDNAWLQTEGHGGPEIPPVRPGYDMRAPTNQDRDLLGPVLFRWKPRERWQIRRWIMRQLRREADIKRWQLQRHAAETVTPPRMPPYNSTELRRRMDEGRGDTPPPTPIRRPPPPPPFNPGGWPR